MKIVVQTKIMFIQKITLKSQFRQHSSDEKHNKTLATKFIILSPQAFIVEDFYHFIAAGFYR